MRRREPLSDSARASPDRAWLDRYRSARLRERPWPRSTSARRRRSAGRSVIARGIARSLRTSTSGAGRAAARRPARVMPTFESARLSTRVDRPRVVAHLRERLEPDLRVLERERVEHPDDAEVGGVVDRRDHLGRERRRGVDDDEVVARAQDLEHLAQEATRSTAAAWSGPQRREQRPRAGRMLGEEAVDLVAVERAARDREVVDRLAPARARAQARRRRTGGRGRRSRSSAPASASATARLHEVSVLPVPPFGPSTVIIAPSVARRRGAATPRERLLEREGELRRSSAAA